MIKTPTVLVLGAGASRPYGFPTAYEMVQTAGAVADGTNDWLLQILETVGIPKPTAKEFFVRLRNSGQYSMDAFLQRQPKDAKDRMIGKATMIAQLIRGESDEGLKA